MKEYIEHPFPALYNAQSQILIRSFPSVKSREQAFFYGHPRNRFWPVMAALLEEPLPLTIAEKKALLLRHGIALWDSIHSCRIHGSSDASITDVEANDLRPILAEANIRHIYCNGKTSLAVYRKYVQPQTHRPAIALPSTSPANAAWTMDRLMEAWAIIKED